MYARVGSEGGVILHDDVSGQGSPVRENNVVSDAAVVSHMRLRHEEIVGSNLGDVAAAFSSPVQSGVLAKHIPFSDEKTAAFAAVLQIVRLLSRRYKREEAAAPAEFRRSFDNAVAIDLNFVVQDDVVGYDRVRADR